MSLLDAIGDAFDILLGAGDIPAPRSLNGQRRARFAACVVAAAVVVSATLFRDSMPLPILIVGVVISGWVAAFSADGGKITSCQTRQ